MEENRAKLDSLAEELIKRETLILEEIREILGGKRGKGKELKKASKGMCMNDKQLWLGKKLLLALIVATVITPLFFIPLNEASLRLNLLKIPVKVGALAGLVLLSWQFLLGFRGAVARLFPDLPWLLALHQKIGTFILPLILLHPLFVIPFYLEKHHKNLLSLNLATRIDFFVLFGMISLALLLLVVGSGLSRPLFRRYQAWFALHLSGYLLLLLVFVHSLAIGSLIKETGLHYPAWGLAGGLALLALYRLAMAGGCFFRSYRVVKASKVGPKVTRIRLTPLDRRLEPAPGQFIFLRRGRWSMVRPFTVSHYDRQSGELSVTVKALGNMTTRLQEIESGEIVLLDGPYGVFGRQALASRRPLVMIAGGIGITPFIRLLTEPLIPAGRGTHLFYGNKNSEDIVYRDEIDGLEQIQVVHVLSDQPDYPGERGFITVDLLQRHLAGDLKEYEFMICGPPIMTEKLRAGLAGAGIPGGQIHYELFSY
jgi:predicted ferric reductase